MSEPNSGQWGKQDSGGSANLSVAHAADGEGPTVEAGPSRGPSDSGAAHSPPHAFGAGLAQPLTELRRVMTSIASHLADRQDVIHKALNSVKFPDFKAGTTQLSALSYELAKPPTELRRVMTSIASHLADRQDVIHKALNSVKFPDFKAGTTQLSALSYELAKPPAELQRVMTSVASLLADRQDGWRKTMDSIKFPDFKALNTPPPTFGAYLAHPPTNQRYLRTTGFELSEQGTETTDDRAVQMIGEIRDILNGESSPPKAKLLYKRFVDIAIAIFVAMLMNMLTGSSDTTNINIDIITINIWETYTQPLYPNN